jgi:hypothetical protein
MPDNDSIRFRKQAEEATERAAKAISPVAKETWLRIAGALLKLAQSVEGRLRYRRNGPVAPDGAASLTAPISMTI